MVKTYTKVTNDQRKELIRLIHDELFTISKAADTTGIYYPTAKAINKIYKNEQRIQKRDFRYRTKKEDKESGVIRNKIAIEKVSFSRLDENSRKRITCGFKLLLKAQILNSKRP
jgi:hypothetical protein